MSRYRSVDASSAHDAPARAMCRSRRHPRSFAGMAELDRCSHGMLRLLQRLVLALATVIGCAVIASPARGSTSQLAVPFAATALVAPGTGGAERGVSAPAPRHYSRDRDSRPVVDRKAVESDDDDDDDDPLADVFDDSGPSGRFVPLARKSRRARRGELQIDTSRFAIGTGFPRGPPA